MKRQTLKCSTLALVASVLLGAATGGNTVQADEIGYATFVSPRHTLVEDGVEPFFNRVSRATDGKISGRIFPSGQLLGTGAILSGISDGIVDSGLVIPQY